MSHWLAEMEKPPSDVWQKVLPRVPAPGARRWHHTLLARANGRVERVCGSLTSKGGGRGASRAEGLAAQNGCPNRVSARSALVCVRDGRRLSEIRLGCSTSEGGSVRGTQHTGWPVNLLRRTPEEPALSVDVVQKVEAGQRGRRRVRAVVLRPRGRIRRVRGARKGCSAEGEASHVCGLSSRDRVRVRCSRIFMCAAGAGVGRRGGAGEV